MEMMYNVHVHVGNLVITYIQYNYVLFPIIDFNFNIFLMSNLHLYICMYTHAIPSLNYVGQTCQSHKI